MEVSRIIRHHPPQILLCEPREQSRSVLGYRADFGLQTWNAKSRTRTGLLCYLPSDMLLIGKQKPKKVSQIRAPYLTLFLLSQTGLSRGRVNLTLTLSSPCESLSRETTLFHTNSPSVLCRINGYAQIEGSWGQTCSYTPLHSHSQNHQIVVFYIHFKERNTPIHASHACCATRAMVNGHYSEQ